MQRVDLVRCLRDPIASAGEGLTHAVTTAGQGIAIRRGVARGLLRLHEGGFGVAHAAVPLARELQSAVTALGRLARTLGELRQVELALLDRNLDLMNLISR